jgi:hypothetical protein
MIRILIPAMLILAATPAQAQRIPGPRASDSTLVSAVISPVCTVETLTSEAVVQLASGVDQGVTTVSYMCNSAGGFTRRVVSSNAGSLMRGTQRIPYSVSEGGDSRLAFPPVHLEAPLVTQVAAFRELTLGARDLLSISLPGIPFGLLAGEYSDTITIEIAPN